MFTRTAFTRRSLLAGATALGGAPSSPASPTPRAA